jgi:hypothetical protein
LNTTQHNFNAEIAEADAEIAPENPSTQEKVPFFDPAVKKALQTGT